MFSAENQNGESIKALVRSELQTIRNYIIKDAIEKISIEPVPHNRKWDYGSNNETFLCWTVARDKNSDTSIVYSEFGFGPENPWGLVSESFLYFGMDTAWFKNLVDCFLDSKMANDLPIWKVEEHVNTFNRKLISENMDLKKAYKKRDELALTNPKFKYFVSPYV